MIMDALLTNKASQRVDKISKRTDHFSFALPLLVPADPGAGSWLKSWWQTLLGWEISSHCLQDS